MSVLGDSHSIDVAVETPHGGELAIALQGRLDSETLPEAWARTVEPVRRGTPKRVVVDASGLAYCDGAGLGLFAELRRMMAESGGELQFRGLSEQLEAMLDMSRLADPTAGQLREVPAAGLAERVGQATLGLIRDLRVLIAFVGQMALALAWAATHPARIRGRDLLVMADKVGTSALPVVSLLGFLVGLILAFQCAGPLRQYGAQDLIPTLLGFAVLKEFGPLITAIVLAGRSGSAFAAEIGTMKVTEELNALETLGLDPTRFLVIPRVLAATIVTPALCVYNMLLALVGGYVMMASLGYSLRFYISQLVGSISYLDVLAGVFKAFVFAIIVAAIGCQRGLATRSGPGAVGDSTTRAVVAGIVLIIVADAVLGVVYFVLGI
jgi:phospholipid/cholesterol/gamma-HCH transport system permease protein